MTDMPQEFLFNLVLMLSQVDYDFFILMQQLDHKADYIRKENFFYRRKEKLHHSQQHGPA